MQRLLEVLQLIRHRPAMYIGHRSIWGLGAFLSGYAFAQSQIEDQESDMFLRDFQRWIYKRFEVTGTQGWERIICFYSEDERDALDVFWSLLDEYMCQIAQPDTDKPGDSSLS